MKTRLFSRVMFIFVLVVVVASSLFMAAKPQAVSATPNGNGFGEPPVLTATITSPANGAVIQSATYMVNASVKCTIAPALGVKLALSVAGPALIQGSAQVTLGDMAVNQTLSASWLVQATNSGSVTFTATPSFPMVLWVPTVYAAGQVLPGSEQQGPFPVDVGVFVLPTIVPASITVNQMFGDVSSSVSPSGGSGGSPGSGSSTPVIITSLTTQPQQVAAGQPVSIMANVSNRNDVTRSYQATLKINDEVVEVKNGSLGGNSARPVEFTISRDKSGTYLVDVNGRQATFTVTGSQSQPVDTRMIIIAIVAILVLAVIVVLIRHFATR